MKIRKISADVIYPVSDEPIKQGVVVVDEKGKVLEVGKRNQYDKGEVEYHQGVIVPGFINTHCHLELSHMKGMVATGTKLIPFITEVVTQRGATAAYIQECIEKGEEEMLRNGVVAVGDISNTTDTFAQKAKGNLRYHTFVEFFDLLQELDAKPMFDQYKAVYDALQLPQGHKKSCVPHAPYSVTPSLFEMIGGVDMEDVTISIHNQETPAENELFLSKSGDFVDFVEGFGKTLKDFSATGKTSIHYALANMNPAHRTLFVHNTLTTEEDINTAQSWSDKVYWATCANANQYIENQLPFYKNFLAQNAKMTIGTDSLTSNWQLSVFEEMKTIHRFQSYLDFETLLKWATLNGAEALGFDDTLGSIEVDKTPGIVLLESKAGEVLTGETRVERLA